MPHLLEVDSVIKSYGVRQVLTDIYLQCKTGDILGMLGRNGSGKSTLLKIIFGILPADEKFIRIDGKVYQCPYKTINELCYLPQHDFIPKHLTVDKAVKLYVEKSAADHFFADKTLKKIRTNKVSDVSGGELRYLEVKLLLSIPCKFVLLDEPFNGVSPILVASIKALIVAASKTKGIILTDHDYRNVLGIANRYCLIFDGGTREINDTYEFVQWGYISEEKYDF